MDLTCTMGDTAPKIFVFVAWAVREVVCFQVISEDSFGKYSGPLCLLRLQQYTLLCMRPLARPCTMRRLTSAFVSTIFHVHMHFFFASLCVCKRVLSLGVPNEFTHALPCACA